MMMVSRSFTIAFLVAAVAVCGSVSAFSPAPLKTVQTTQHTGQQTQLSQKENECVARRLGPLFMGRAAAVRASTKAKTDAKKSKVNALYGKRIIMAVKQGGGPDQEANTMLRDVVKAAKANSVPVDVSCLLLLGVATIAPSGIIM